MPKAGTCTPVNSASVNRQHVVLKKSNIRGHAKHLSQRDQSDAPHTHSTAMACKPPPLQPVATKRGAERESLLSEPIKKRMRIVKSGELGRSLEVQKGSGTGRTEESGAGEAQRAALARSSADRPGAQAEKVDTTRRPADGLPVKVDSKPLSQVDDKQAMEQKVAVEKCDSPPANGTSRLGTGSFRCSAIRATLDKLGNATLKERLKDYISEPGPETVGQQSTAIAQDTGFPLSLHVRGFGSPWEEEKSKELELPESPVTPPGRDDSSPEKNLPFFLDHKLPTPDISNVSGLASADRVPQGQILLGIRVKEEPIDDGMAGSVGLPKESPTSERDGPPAEPSVSQPSLGRGVETPLFYDVGHRGLAAGQDNMPGDKWKQDSKQLPKKETGGGYEQTLMQSTVKLASTEAPGTKFSDLPPHLAKRFSQNTSHPWRSGVGEDNVQGNDGQGTSMVGSQQTEPIVQHLNNPLLPPHLSSRQLGLGTSTYEGHDQGKQDLPFGGLAKGAHTSWHHPSHYDSDSSDDVLRFSSRPQPKAHSRSPTRASFSSRSRSPWQRGRLHSSHHPERQSRSTSCHSRSAPVFHTGPSCSPPSSR